MHITPPMEACAGEGARLLCISFFVTIQHNQISQESSRFSGDCGGNVFGMDAKIKLTERYLRRFPE
jgi:hypothetical protein